MSAEIAILIPTLGRADELPALVENIAEATSTPYRIHFIVEHADRETIEAVTSLPSYDRECCLLVGDYGSCSKALNAGYRKSTEPIVVIANDDCVFHPGWDTTALGYFSDTIHIVGMNDGTGDPKCFSMVRRSYIEQHSGVFDKPNTLFHTYKSQGPDTEFAFYAILRGVWAPAFDAVVEHRRMDPAMHFKARDTINQDLDEYNRRWPQWDPERRMPPAVPTVRPS